MYPQEITRLLLAVGVPAQLNGYQYLREAIFMTLQSVEYISSVTKRLYPSLADQFGVTAASVERAIRHAIETSWARGSVEMIDCIFGYTVDDCKENNQFGVYCHAGGSHPHGLLQVGIRGQARVLTLSYKSGKMHSFCR